MKKIKIYTVDGAESNEKELSHLPVLDGEKGLDALRQVIVALQANARQGTAKAKNRSEVRGTGAKPWRQKGTGRARHGSRRSPIWVGGGAAHGPRPRDYTQKINRQVKRLANLRALNDKIEQDGIVLVEKLHFSEPKTKLFVNFLSAVFPVSGEVLVVDSNFEDNTILSARNIAGVYLSDVDSLNALDLTQFKKILFTESAFNQFVERIG